VHQKKKNVATHCILFIVSSQRYWETKIQAVNGNPFPNVIIMNSCLWDITRYGADGLNAYKRSN